jgi:hypothetical protein
MLLRHRLGLSEIRDRASDTQTPVVCASGCTEDVESVREQTERGGMHVVAHSIPWSIAVDDGPLTFARESASARDPSPDGRA